MNVKAPQTTSASARSLDAPGWPGGIAPAPLLLGEDATEYARFTAQFLAAAKPRDFIEEILARDAIDLSWEILRYRRLKAGLLRMASGAVVRRVAERFSLEVRQQVGWLANSANKWTDGDATARKGFEKLLETADLGMDDIMAEALSSKIDPFERIDRMLASSEARRNNALREIDRHRSTLGAAVRQAIDKVEDVEFRDVETGELSGGSSP
jgi:hypothetical protein